MNISRKVASIVLATSLLSFVTTIVVSKPADPPATNVASFSISKKATRLPFCSKLSVENGQKKEVCVALADIALLALLAIESARAHQ